MTFPARIVQIKDEVATTDLPLRNPLLANTRVAVRLKAHQLRPHLYIVHKASAGGLIVIGYVQTTVGPRANIELRVPQPGAWFLCPAEGEVFVVPSDKVLTMEEIEETTALPGGRTASALAEDTTLLDFVEIEAAPPPVGGDKTAGNGPDTIPT